MSDEPGHKAMLYFLEVLMNSTGPLTISQLAGRFGSSNFTPEMRTAAGGNESGLKQFLLKYPSLFTIRGNMVALYDGKEEEEAGGQESSASSSSASRRSLPDVSVEMEAVQFFQHQLGKREEKWVPVKSLAGHLSQTTSEVRNIVGPQLEFKKWLLRHMHIFEVQGDLVTLREGLAPVQTPQTQRRITFDLPNDDVTPPPMMSSTVVPPKTPPPQRRGLAQKNTSSLHRSHSFSDRTQLNQSQGHLMPSPSTPGLMKRHNSPVTMTANEYKAVMYVKDVLEKKGAMKLQTLGLCLGQASDNIRSTAGTSQNELEDFVKRNSGIFTIVDEDTVDLIKNAKLSVIITGSKPPATSGGGGGGRTSNTGKGKIFHVAKLWGIIDLGEHEHVFFDRSIMQKPMDDLQKHFQIGEMLCFNAILAHKTSRAKWKATHVWKENEQEPSSSASDDMEPSGSRGMMSLSHSVSIEDEINEFLPKPDRDGYSDPVAVFNDAELSGAGVIPIWNFKQDEEKNKRATVSIVPESYQMSASALSDLRFVPDFSASFLYGSSTGGATIGTDSMQNGQAGKSEARAAAVGGVAKPKKFASVACQTVSTNDIIATQLYQDA